MKRVRIVVDLTPVQADRLSLIACGGALASENDRTARTMWRRVFDAVGKVLPPKTNEPVKPDR